MKTNESAVCIPQQITAISIEEQEKTEKGTIVAICT